ncbi:MAG: hypothetical protein RLP09_44005 [Sandaracinaceae bacterium]
MKTALCLSLALLLTGGCSVAYPTQWNARATSAENVDATPWVVYANTPTSWESRDGQIQLRSTRHERLSGMGLYRLDLEFEVELVGPSGRIITCRTEPTGPDVPSSRFGCWSGPEGERLRLWIAPGEDCPSRDAGVMRTQTSPACWNGELTFEGDVIRLSSGHLESTGSPVGYITWVSDEGELLLAANIVAEQRIQVFGGPSPVPDRLRRALLPLTVALHHWRHAS